LRIAEVHGAHLTFAATSPHGGLTVTLEFPQRG